MSNQKENTNPRLREVIHTLQDLSTKHVQEPDLNKIQIQYARLTKRLVGAEMSALLFIDPEDNRILIRKILIGENDWSIEDSFQIDHQQLSELFQDREIIQIKKSNELICEVSIFEPV